MEVWYLQLWKLRIPFEVCAVSYAHNSMEALVCQDLDLFLRHERLSDGCATESKKMTDMGRSSTRLPYVTGFKVVLMGLQRISLV